MALILKPQKGSNMVDAQFQTPFAEQERGFLFGLKKFRSVYQE
jgi:hypothetical protein